jgi:uncharacterized membrane protein
MDNLDDLKALWHTADTASLPDAGQVVRTAKRYRNHKIRKKIFLISASALLGALMIGVMFFYKSTMLVTRIGELLMVFSAGILVYTNLRSIGRFYRYNDFTNRQFLEFMEQTRLNQLRYYNKTQIVTLVCSSAGMFLYLVELALHDPIAGAIFYAIMIATFLVLWLVIRPRTFRKQLKKTNDTIARLKTVTSKLDSDI